MKSTFRFAPYLLCFVACAGKTPEAQSPENSDESASSSSEGESASDTPEHKPAKEHATLKDDDKGGPMKCGGFDVPDLLAVLSQASCEVPNGNPEAEQARDVKDLLDVTIKPESTRVAGGSQEKVRVTFHNKSKADLPLDFVVDPEPQFGFEVYTLKGNRADKPAGEEPSIPQANGPEPEKKIARVTLAPEGTAGVTLTWNAVKYKWASKDKAKGALPGHGYPRDPAGPLPKGKYILRAVTPLVGVFEGVDHEVSQPRVPIEVGNP